MIKSLQEMIQQYWDAQPCNIRHSAAKLGTRKYFEEVAHRKYFVEPHIPAFANFAAWKGKEVLEIGCGIGTDGIRFAAAGAHYLGIDVSAHSVALAKARFDLYGIKGFVIHGNAEELADLLPPCKFDLIYAFGVLHHTPNPQKVVDAVARFMDEQSEFRLMLYARQSWKAIMIEAGLDQPEAQCGCPLAKTYSRAEARFLLRDFDIISLRQTHIFPYVVKDYIRHRYRLQPWFKAMPKAMFRALEERLGWHLLIVAREKRLKGNCE